jgi:hypothetical protein
MDVAVEEEVEVERAGAAGRPSASVRTRPRSKQQLEEPARAERRFERRRSVQESRLVGHRSDRVGLAQRRHGDDLDAGRRCEALERSA